MSDLARLCKISESNQASTLSTLETKYQNLIEEIKELKTEVKIQPTDINLIQNPQNLQTNNLPISNNIEMSRSYQSNPYAGNMNTSKSFNYYNPGFFRQNYQPRARFRNDIIPQSQLPVPFRRPKTVGTNTFSPRLTYENTRPLCQKCGYANCKFGRFCYANNKSCNHCAMRGHLSSMCRNVPQ